MKIVGRIASGLIAPTSGKHESSFDRIISLAVLRYLGIQPLVNHSLKALWSLATNKVLETSGLIYLSERPSSPVALLWPTFVIAI